ncbi:MAG: ATPase [Candidatus Cloacimonetes bacterium HGW-Cloacimonetes-3]|jgi:ABC-type multidrug transport system ATPase subunit|nr:MAG: ATPase [Candidatus Cloacimonetes bacterium HGW-Cloacimonetes-3]
MQPFISATNISKRYGTTQALDNVSFEVGKDEIVGFIGADGAGKSTLFEIMTTLLIPDAGEGYINGMSIDRDYQKIRSCIGFMPGRFSLYQDLSVEENLRFYANIFGSSIQENYAMIEGIYTLLKPFGKRKAGALSGGMKQKLALCCALIHKPLALFLDEPTTGVDAVSRTEFWDNLIQIRDSGIPIVVSTPYMDEALRCDRVAMIHEGKIMDMDTPKEIIKAYKGCLLGIFTGERYLAKAIVYRLAGIESVYTFGDSVHINLPTCHPQIMKQIADSLKQGLSAEFQLRELNPSFEDCFLQLMGQAANER